MYLYFRAKKNSTM